MAAGRALPVCDGVVEMKTPVCNKDCFNCPFPDCINDEMDHEDYIAAAARDKELRSTPKSKKVAAQKKAYYEANREKVAAQQKAYYEANREKVAAQKKAYYEANREKLFQRQREIAEVRKQMGLSQNEAAKILGVSQATISLWEKGCVVCDVDSVIHTLRQEAG